jgi:hypothetical protein
MNCLRCNTPNEDGAKFCKNCGMDMTYTPSNENSNSASSDKLLFTYVCISFFVFISIFAIDKLVDNPYEGPIKYIRGSLWILRNLSVILIPLLIKNISLKIIGLILTIIYTIYYIYNNVEFMIS